MDAQDKQNLAVALVVVALIVGAYWLMSQLHRQSQIEECLMQRRRNCDQIVR